MNTGWLQTLRWTPRILGIAFTCFISLFALDVFGENQGFWRTLAALSMHLIPSFVLIAMLVLAWRWEWIGAVVSAVLGGLFLWWNFTYRHNTPAAVVVIAGPLFLTAGLYLLSWARRPERHVPNRRWHSSEKTAQ